MTFSHSLGNGRVFSRFRCRSLKKPSIMKAVEARVLRRKDFPLRLRTAASTTEIHARIKSTSASKSSLGGIAMNTHSISRRLFAQLLGVGAAAAIVRPRITIATEAPTVPAPAKPGVVRSEEQTSELKAHSFISYAVL